jgi:membrane protein implicated in regulation of membrane protease activity
MESFKLLYWHWLVFGMILMMLELVVPSFTILWFGLGGLVVGLILLIFANLAFTWQIFIWVVSSIGFTLFWFKILKPKMEDRTMAGLSREAVLGETATVISRPEGNKRGELRFTIPVLGAEVWKFICDKPVELGDRVIVKDVSGNTLIVNPIKTTNIDQEG